MIPKVTIRFGMMDMVRLKPALETGIALHSCEAV
jgi:hypothetical protein